MKKSLIIFLVFISSLASAQFFYGSGEAVNLENRIKFKKQTTSIDTGSTTPTSGVSRSTGSVYMKNDGTFWVKQYGASTAWSRVATASEIPSVSGYLTETGYAQVSNKDLNPSSVYFVSSGNGYVRIDPSGSTGNSLTRMIFNSTATREITFQNATGTVAYTSDIGITSLGGLNGAAQTLATGSTGGDFNISSSGTAHTFHLPDASASNRGLLTQANFQTFNNKLGTLNGLTGSSQTFATGSAGGDVAFSSSSTTHTLNIPNASASNRGVLTQANYQKIFGGTGNTGPLKSSSGTFATGTINLASTDEVTGTLGWPRGGTNATTFTNGAVIYATGSAFASLTGVATTDVIRWNGSQWQAMSEAPTVTQTHRMYQAGSSMTDRTAELEFNLGTATITSSGSGLFTVTDDAGSTRTKWIALKRIIVHVSAAARPVTINRPLRFMLNGTVITMPGSSNPAGDPAHVSTSLLLNGGDYLTLLPATYDGGTSDSVPNSTDLVYANIVAIEVQ